MYDITVVGSGVSSIFFAYTLSQSNQKILLIEKGKPLEERNCPLDRAEPCDCNVCDKYFGFAGLGKSEGKFNYSNDFGGDLGEKIGTAKFHRLMDEIDSILCEFGGDAVPKYSTVNEALSKRVESTNLQMLTTETRHIGTSLSIKIFQKLYEELSSKIDIKFECDVLSIEKVYDTFNLVTNKGNIQSKQVVLATGQSGASWLKEQCNRLGVKQGKTRLDLGIRVEMSEGQLRYIMKETFEMKLSLTHDEIISTTYCMNPQGRIIRKFQEGLVMPDGQNFREQKNGTTNLNFTLFTPQYFSTVEEANMYAQKIIGGINNGSDRILVQRLGDLRNGQATSNESMGNNRIQPTLHANLGDLTTEVPLLYIQILLEFLDELEKMIGESVDDDTLLYGMDGKFYSPIIETDENFQTSIEGLYVIGDCSGVTHSLSQAAASGIFVAEVLSG